MAPGPKTTKILALLAAARKSLAALSAQLDDIEAVLEDQKTPGQQAKDLLAAFAVAWAARHGRPYVVTGAKDMGMLKKLLASMPAEDIAARMARYFASPHQYYVERSFPLSVMVAHINQLGGSDRFDAEAFLRAPVTGCSHMPQCLTDQAHTQRKLMDARRPAVAP